ncbi:MAG: hypothetical protein H8E57_10295 [Candidatus Cloacimonetes bacterium]|nr:hypothetical protein [Candidatus Cloacimonadota bacterium]
MKFWNLFLLFVLCGSIFGNSVFSFDGIPIQNYGSDVYGKGMGESGISDLYRINTNYFNPSIAAMVNKVIFSTAVSLGNFWYSDISGKGYRDDGLDFPYFSITVPAANHKFAFNFNSFASGNLENELQNSWNDYEYSEVNRINSNIFKADLIYAHKNKFLNLGLALNYYFGHKTRFWELDFSDSEMTDTKYESEQEFKNPGFAIGACKKIKNIAFGFSYSSYTKLDGNNYFKYIHSPFQDTLTTGNDYLYEIPERMSGGVTVKLTEKFKTSFDLYYDFYKKTEKYEQNTFKAAFGFAYEPLSGYGKWYEKIPLRLGGYYRELPFLKNDEKVIEKAFTSGFSIPLKSPSKKIDVAVKYLVRGDTNLNRLRDKSIVFSIGITGFDIFSKRPKKIKDREIPEADAEFE